MSQLLERDRGKRAALLGGERRGQEPSGHLAVNRTIEDPVSHEGLDFREMLAAGLVTFGIVAEVRWFERQLVSDEGEHGYRWLFVLA
jgi:hypothetical protein